MVDTIDGEFFVKAEEDLLDAIYERYGHDFRQYAIGSLKRRIQYAAARLHLNSTEDFHHYILSDNCRIRDVIGYLTVPISEMFRDSDYFLALRHKILPQLDRYARPTIWVPGCSTGEEVYSLAILLSELRMLEKTDLYATDISETALEIAKKGIFSIRVLKKYIRNYRESGGLFEFSDYYHAGYGSFLIDRNIRESIKFVKKSVFDEDFSDKIHLISCRNTLIYFNASLRRDVLNIFNKSLCKDGFLGLGRKESLFARDEGFRSVSDLAKIYMKR